MQRTDSMDGWYVTLILVVALILFVTERIPVALTAIGIMVALVLGKVLDPQTAVAGLAHPAVITVGSMFLISRGLVRTGSVEYLARRIVQLAKGKIGLATTAVILTVTAASAFINNTPVVILFIPVVMTMCCEFNLSPSRFLIPISYASILAGTCTLIGTSTNIIVSDLSAQHGLGPLSFFELSIVGIPIAVIGILFIILSAPYLMPSLANPVCQIKDQENRRYLAELKIPRGSKLINKDPKFMFSVKYPEVSILEVIRYSHIFHPDRDDIQVSADDVLLVKGSASDLVALLDREDLSLPASERGLSFGASQNEALVVELIITPQSALLGQRLIESRLMKDPDIHVIAIKRSNLHFTEKQVRDVRLKNGDMILIWCFSDRLTRMRANSDYLIIEDVYEEIVHKRKAWKATGIFVGMVVVAALGLGGMILLTSIGTQVLSNNATAVLMVPIALSTAASIGLDPKPFVMGICFGAGACFASPIGYQTNLLVYGPGGYRFSDFLKMGIPLNLLVVVLATVLIPVFWPF